MSSSKKLRKWKLGTVNMFTGSDDFKVVNAVTQTAKAKLSICGLQEVRRLRQGSKLVECPETNKKYEFHWSGHQKGTKRDGVGILIEVHDQIEVLSVEYISARILSTDVRVFGYFLKIIVCYAPTEMKSDNMKTTFYRSLRTESKKRLNSKQKLCVIGDMNATFSASLQHSSIRPQKNVPDNVYNNSGERMLDFVRDTNLSVLNTWFKKSKLAPQMTWYSNDGKTKKCIDFILCESHVRQFAVDCRVRMSYDYMSDHRLLVASLITPQNRSARHKHRCHTKKPKLDLSLLKSGALTSQFADEIEKSLATNPPQTIALDLLNDHIVTTLQQAAEKTLPSITKTHEKIPCRDDPDFRALLLQRDEANLTPDTSLQRRLTRQVRKKAKELKERHYAEEGRQINQMAITRNLERLFARAQKQETLLRPIAKPVRQKSYTTTSRIISIHRNLRTTKSHSNSVSILHGRTTPENHRKLRNQRTTTLSSRNQESSTPTPQQQGIQRRSIRVPQSSSQF